METRESGFIYTYVSTTLPYVNAPPHVGFALELAQTDALVRALRLFGKAVQVSSGSDDHSLKNVRAAEAQGVPVQAYVDGNRRRFEELARVLDVHFDDLVWTSLDVRHRATVQRLFLACAAKGDVYRKRYAGTYCVGCESFLSADELHDGLCPEHGQRPEWIEEENWFFRLSHYREALIEAVVSGRLSILPEERRNEVLGFLHSGLHDFSVSRAAARAHGFGIPVPNDPSQTVYVWVDALANYLTTWDYGSLGEKSGWQAAERRIHLLGKGVLRFHAVYWPALLLSAGLPLPSELRVHGHLTVDGRKIGKSLGNGVDPIALAKDLGPTALRYYLLRHIPPFKDADFSLERLLVAHDSELADELGNLARRVLTLVHRYAGGRVPELGALGSSEHELEALASKLPGALWQAIERHELSLALDTVWQLVRATNRYLDVTAPWHLARQGRADGGRANPRLSSVLATSVGALRAIALLLEPFVPALAKSLADAVGASVCPVTLREFSVLSRLPVGLELGAPPLLVPRLRTPPGSGSGRDV